MSDPQTESAPSEDQPTPETTQAPSKETSAAQKTESSEYFSDQFDVNTLDEPLQARYREMEAGLTKKFQEVAEQRKQAESVTALYNDLRSEDPETKQNALTWMAQNGLLSEDEVAQVFGYEFDDQDQEDPDPVAELRQWRDNFESERQTKAQQDAEEAFVQAADAHISGQVDSINAELKKAGRGELSDAEQQLIVSRALVAHTGPDGMPNVDAAYKEYEAQMDARLKGWASTKETTHTSPGGQAATGVPDVANMSREERHAWQRQRLAELSGEAGPGT